MLAPCGFLCDRCVAFKDNAKCHADRVRGSAAWAKHYGLESRRVDRSGKMTTSKKAR